MHLHHTYYLGRDRCRGFLETHSLKMLPLQRLPAGASVLDIGCGSGVSCLILATRTDACFTLIDQDPRALGWLRKKLKDRGLTERFTVYQTSCMKKKLPEKKYDLIMAEGVFHLLGYARAFRRFTPLIREGGYLFLHEDHSLQQKLEKVISKYPLQIVEFTHLDESVWWNDYYRCLDALIREVELEYPKASTLGELTHKDKNEISAYHQDPSLFQSVLYLLQWNSKKCE